MLNMLVESFVYIILFLLLVSLFIDLSIGELPSKVHPVVFIGNSIDFFTKRFIMLKNKFSGFLLTFCTILFIFLFFIILFNILFILFRFLIYPYDLIISLIVYGAFLSTLYSIKLLISSTHDIKIKLQTNLNDARDAMSYLVSRNTHELSQESIISASIETMTENITDSYVSSIIYFLLFSLIGIIIKLNYNQLILLSLSGPLVFRITNTLDAMVGYDNEKYHYIGWFPAKIDDILNYIPARFTGYMVVIASFILKLDYKNSYKILKRDALRTPSPNSGFTMSAVAGALNIQLEKKDTYILGDKTKKLTLNDIDLSIKLTRMTIIVSTIILILIYLIVNCLI